ncbi:MAG TPA: zf-HC2 domain-containing protein [Streptosporangiaceae bacterium]|nr:zf-HC2 domain-containing protein [Streptosporangiaceae bacterium]
MSDPSCRTFRELLGVYVVGAIEPGERAAVDTHLNQCYECREELAALAPLPALLHRVPLAEAERIAAAGPVEPDPAESSAEMLDALLKQVGARRRTRRFRAMFTAAAAVLIAVGGAAAVSQSLTPHPSHARFDVATASIGRLGATVHYGQSKWDATTMSVQVTGFRQWTSCKFWVITKDGQRKLSGGWIVGPGADKLWYPVYSGVPESNVRGFEITWGSKGALQIPAD